MPARPTSEVEIGVGHSDDRGTRVREWGPSTLSTQVSRREREEVAATTPVDLRTVLITDIVGSTAKQVELGDRAWRDLLLAHRRLVRQSLVRWHGYENDTAGDGFYVTFADPTDAVRCALEIAQSVRSLGIEVRAGLHRGTCELAEDKCSGLTVSIAARVAAFAAGSDVVVTDAVRAAVNDARIRYDLCCVRELRGVPGRWSLWSVRGSELAEAREQ